MTWNTQQTAKYTRFNTWYAISRRNKNVWNFQNNTTPLTTHHNEITNGLRSAGREGYFHHLQYHAFMPGFLSLVSHAVPGLLGTFVKIDHYEKTYDVTGILSYG